MLFDYLFPDLVLAEAQKVTVHDSSSGDDEQVSSPTKTLRVFSGYQKKHKKSMDHGSSVKAELIRYIQVSSDEDRVDCLEFWKRQSKAFPRLYPVAMRVTASNAPVERGVQPRETYYASPLCKSVSKKAVKLDVFEM